MIRTQIQLPEPDYEQLREIAARERRSMADCIREGVQLFLDRSRRSGGDLDSFAGKFRPLPADDLKAHDRWYTETAHDARSPEDRP